jgi:alpha-methylacyl-CoA racemase
MSGTDACALPVLTTEEAAALDLSSSPIPVPHPRIVGQGFETPKHVGLQSLALRPGQHTREILTELGLDDAQLEEMVRDGAIEISKAHDSKL